MGNKWVKSVQVGETKAKWMEGEYPRTRQNYILGRETGGGVSEKITDTWDGSIPMV
jgi:hypothetical protein